jgi:hypothetical protein
MIGDAVKQTRCTTCEADHEYKHAAVPRQRKKPEQSALYSQVLASTVPKRIVTPAPPAADISPEAEPLPAPPAPVPEAAPRGAAAFEALFASSEPGDGDGTEGPVEEGPAHRRLIRAQLPRHEGQVTTARQTPDFTIRQPAAPRGKRFPGRHRGGSAPQGNRPGGLSSHNSGNRGGASRAHGKPGGGRPGNHRSGGGRNRPK